MKNGVIVVDKPEGFTSFDVIAKLRGILHERKMGHSGTLDPMATGVLPVFIGKATKAIDIIPNDNKRYTAKVRLGLKTDSGDITGQIIAQNDNRADLDKLITAAKRKTGVSMQIPPMYSAIKVNGQRLYDLARQGKTVERKPRQIEIFDADVYGFDGNEFCLEVYCRKGLYVRTLAEDIAEECGCLATLVELRRTQSGPFTEKEALGFDEIEDRMKKGNIEGLIIPVEKAFTDYPLLSLGEKEANKFLNGVKLPTDIPEGENVRINSENVFLGIACSQEGVLVKKVQFFDMNKEENE